METHIVDPAMQDLFPLAASIDLKSIQSTHMVNEGIASGSFKEAYENIPDSIDCNTSQELFHDQMKLGKHYFKENWKALLAAFASGLLAGGIGAIIVYRTIQASNEANPKKDNPPSA